MIRQRILQNPILIPIVVGANKFIQDKITSMSIAVLPKGYTLMSLNVELLSSFGTGITCDLGTKDNTDLFAKGIVLSTQANTESSTKTTLSSSQELVLSLNKIPTQKEGILAVRIMMFSPSATYMEI
ncbi:hypothetical protein [Helicobacter sp. 13S00477-4]|uniref:hypothetical protein n=1 Tax=Helicobacter sp. 13S00477-4 TaxID=1905759 RepID=UPI000BA5114B|nr:hypothetical protein [Helicobacter sp. 13S00477-4]PAF51982.1 hypothetical protein BKH44_04800 [Helicobacter sp. 13S00477-4]